jgi:hypothetical protein
MEASYNFMPYPESLIKTACGTTSFQMPRGIIYVQKSYLIMVPVQLSPKVKKTLYLRVAMIKEWRTPEPIRAELIVSKEIHHMIAPANAQTTDDDNHMGIVNEPELWMNRAVSKPGAVNKTGAVNELGSFHTPGTDFKNRKQLDGWFGKIRLLIKSLPLFPDIMLTLPVKDIPVLK